MRRFSIVAVVLIFAFCATAVWAQAGAPRQRRDGTGPAGPMGPGIGCAAGALGLPRAQLLERGAEELQLSAEQQTKLREILAQHDQTVLPLMRKTNEATMMLRNAVMAPEYDAQNVQSLATAAQRAEADVLQARVLAWAQVRQVLTAEQMTKLREMMSRPRQAPADGAPRQRQGNQRSGGPGPDGPGAPPPQ